MDIDGGLNISGFEGISDAVVQCELMVDTDPIETVTAAGTIDAGTATIRCDATSILKTSETVCHAYQVLISIDRVRSDWTDWIRFNADVDPRIANVDRRTIRVIDLTVIED